MLVEFSIVPIGACSSIGDHISSVLKIVDASGLPYKINLMGTVVEGSWDDIMKLIKKCQGTIIKDEDRVYTTISIDDRKGRPDRIDEKVKSVEKRIGKTLKQ